MKNIKKTLKKHHPWIFSGAIERVDGEHKSGDLVRVLDCNGALVGHGIYSANSKIAIRLLSFENENFNIETLIKEKIISAIKYRKDLGFFDSLITNSFRLIYSESDGLPGVIADYYNKIVVLQLTSWFSYKFKELIIETIKNEIDCVGLYEKSDKEICDLEGVPSNNRIISGEIPEQVEILENNLKFYVDIFNGQKSGFFLDQRENRELIGEISNGKRVLNCFCYTGGFSVYALKGNAKEVISVDISEGALENCKNNIDLNGYGNRSEIVCADLFKYLRLLRDKNEKFDLIILDPPKFAKSGSQVENAANGYKDINLLAIKLLNKGGLLATFSCSRAIDTELFTKIVAGAAYDAKSTVKVVKNLSQSIDHGFSLNFTEGLYLKGLLCYKVD